MQFTDVLGKRRAIRQYNHQSIERAEITTLISQAILAPSAMNMQPWAFAVVLGSERVEDYGKRAKEWLLSSTASYEPSLRHMLEDPSAAVFHHAPALVLVLATSAAQQATEDCCLAAENFMLAARERDLGTCWIGLPRPWLDLPQTKTELGVPGHYHVIAPIIIGHAEHWPDSPGRRAPEIHWLP